MEKFNFEGVDKNLKVEKDGQIDINFEGADKERFMTENHIPPNYEYLVANKDGVFSFNREEYLRLRNQELNAAKEDRNNLYPSRNPPQKVSEGPNKDFKNITRLMRGFNNNK